MTIMEDGDDVDNDNGVIAMLVCDNVECDDDEEKEECYTIKMDKITIVVMMVEK